MARECAVCGKQASVGNSVEIRGKAKYLGGVGLKTTSVKKRTFKPNLQTVDTMIDGTPTRVRASVQVHLWLEAVKVATLTFCARGRKFALFAHGRDIRPHCKAADERAKVGECEAGTAG